MAIFSSRSDSDVQIHASNSRDFIDKPRDFSETLKATSIRLTYLLAAYRDLKYLFLSK